MTGDSSSNDSGDSNNNSGNNGQNNFNENDGDSQSPVNTSFSDFIENGANNTISGIVSIAISATDEEGITGYLVSEKSSQPDILSSEWQPVTLSTGFSTNLTFKLSNGHGYKTIYVWFKDSAGNISDTASDVILFSDGCVDNSSCIKGNKGSDYWPIAVGNSWSYGSSSPVSSIKTIESVSDSSFIAKTVYSSGEYELTTIDTPDGGMYVSKMLRYNASKKLIDTITINPAHPILLPDMTKGSSLYITSTITHKETYGITEYPLKTTISVVGKNTVTTAAGTFDGIDVSVSVIATKYGVPQKVDYNTIWAVGVGTIKTSGSQDNNSLKSYSLNY